MPRLIALLLRSQHRSDGTSQCGLHLVQPFDVTRHTDARITGLNHVRKPHEALHAELNRRTALKRGPDRRPNASNDLRSNLSNPTYGHDKLGRRGPA